MTLAPIGYLALFQVIRYKKNSNEFRLVIR
jgi:hypothetical protein